MRVFVTGGTGQVGSALLPELTAAGHSALVLCRTQAAAAAIARPGVEVRSGDLGDLDVLRDAARDADGVIHLAFREDAMRSGDMAGAVESDLAAVRAIGEVLEGTQKPFVGASVMLPFATPPETVTEDTTKPTGPRVDSENYEISLAQRGVRSSVVRLSPVTHSPALDQHGFARVLASIARRTGVSAYISDGRSRWSAAHMTDTARLFLAALETAPAGSRLHAVAEEAVSTREIAAAIGAHLGLPVVSISPTEAESHFGFLASLLQIDAPASSEITRRLVHWTAAERGLLADLSDDRYYED